MLAVVVVMVVIVVIAGLVAAYVAYPHRGEQMPGTPWLGDAMAKAADAAPLLPAEDDEMYDLRGDLEESERRH
ncbi:hypothetical protein [Nocardioides conyzicola]|uniref:Uncharacterized protein n=1 Tax=Nocardioides conyzicola TaxID=1651781 RepID=A0ABP8WIW6_9ACTN